jgi:hypothetical protein
LPLFGPKREDVAMSLDFAAAVLIVVAVEIAALMWCIALVRVSASSQRSEGLELRRWVGEREQRTPRRR